MRGKIRTPRVRRAPTQQKIIAALARDYPMRLHNKNTVLQTKILEGENQDSVRKSLGGRAGPVREVLLLRRTHERVMLPEMGIVAVSVSIVSLNAAHEQWKVAGGAAWRKKYRAWKRLERGEEPRPATPEPSQERILDAIVSAAHAWIDEELAPSNDSEGVQLMVLDGSIVHGSGSFDLMITVLYRRSEHFTRFIREVVQRIPHVSATQTLQVPYRVGFPNIDWLEHGA
jgi:hypothetical protein